MIGTQSVVLQEILRLLSDVLYRVKRVKLAELKLKRLHLNTQVSLRTKNLIAHKTQRNGQLTGVTTRR